MNFFLSLLTAIWSILLLLIRLPQRLLSRRFSDFEPQQPVAKVPRILMVEFKVLLFMYPIFFLLGLQRHFRSARHKIYQKMLDHLRKNASPIAEAEPLREVDISDLTSHLENFFEHPAPFVVRNFQKDTPALKTWSADWFTKHYGDFLCSSSEVADHTPRRLSSLLAEKTYVNFLDRIFRVHPELEEQLEVKDITATLPKLLGIERTYNELFISTASESGSGLHNHSVWNFFIQIDGRKKWTLIDPEFSHLVYSASHTLEFGTELGLYGDSSSFPLYEFCPRYEVTLNPGDLLFNPPMWWHSIENQGAETDHPQSNIGITLKYYDSLKTSVTTFSDPRFNRFNEIQCLWRGLFILRYAKFLKRERIKYSTDPNQTECPVQARLWPHDKSEGKSANRWGQFRYLCLNDPEANQY